MDAISCLAPPPAASFADAAIARALHFSSTTTTMSPGHSSGSSSFSHNHSPLLADLPSTYYAPPPPPVPAPHAAACCHSILVSDSPRRRSSPTKPAGRQNHAALAPAGARAGKRRSRASKRAPTTYISTDAANFRLMVQQITGVQADGGVDVMMMLQQTTATQLLSAGDEASALRQHQHQHQHQHQLQLQLQLQQPCFPTLDSWNVVSNSMYEMTNSADML